MEMSFNNSWSNSRLPIGITTIAAGLWLLPEMREPHGSRLPDALSALSLLVAVSLPVFATVQGPEWSWGNWRTIALFVVAAFATALTVQRTFKAPSPIIEKTLLRLLARCHRTEPPPAALC